VPPPLPPPCLLASSSSSSMPPSPLHPCLLLLPLPTSSSPSSWPDVFTDPSTHLALAFAPLPAALPPCYLALSLPPPCPDSTAALPRRKDLCLNLQRFHQDAEQERKLFKKRKKKVAKVVPIFKNILVVRHCGGTMWCVTGNCYKWRGWCASIITLVTMDRVHPSVDL
jgi:hypothetical protein